MPGTGTTSSGRTGRVVATLAVAVLAMVAVPPTAQAAELPGDPLTPGPSIQSGAPVTTGVYTVDMPSNGGSQFFEVPRKIKGSTLWAGVSADFASGDEAELDVSAYADGDSTKDCGEGGFLDSGFSVARGLRTGLFSTSGPVCSDAKSMVVEVRGSGAMPPGDYQLVVWEEPPVKNTDQMPVAAGSPSVIDVPKGKPKAITAGQSYADAPLLADGSYKVTLKPGDEGLLRVPLDWGEHVQVDASVGIIEDNFSDIGARWITPMGGAVEAASPAGGLGVDTLQLYDGGEHRAQWATPSIYWRNREIGGSEDVPMALAGDHFLQIELPDEGIPSQGVTLTLNARTVQDTPDAAPEYTSETQMPTVTGELVDPADPIADDSGDGESTQAAGGAESRNWPVIILLFLGSAVFATAGTFSLGRARKARA